MTAGAEMGPGVLGHAGSDDAKRAAAERAATLVQDGMRLGLGTGSTAVHFVAALGRRVARGLRVVCVPTSEATYRQADALGIPLASLDDEPELDLTVDGADEIDPDLLLIKGGGGALLREKLVAAASRHVVVIADAGKQVARLGRFPLPIEVVPFGLETTRRRIAAVLRDFSLPDILALRGSPDAPFRTDGGHVILDARPGLIPDARALAAALDGVLGVVEHGLFVDLAHGALIGTPGGVMEVGDVAVGAPR